MTSDIERELDEMLATVRHRIFLSQQILDEVSRDEARRQYILLSWEKAGEPLE